MIFQRGTLYSIMRINAREIQFCVIVFLALSWCVAISWVRMIEDSKLMTEITLQQVLEQMRNTKIAEEENKKLMVDKNARFAKFSDQTLILNLMIEHGLTGSNDTSLLAALLTCRKMAPFLCTGLTGELTADGTWNWSARVGAEMKQQTTENLILKHAKEVLSGSPSEFESANAEIIWDGPLQDTFLAGLASDDAMQSWTDIDAAKAWCVRAADCAGITSQPLTAIDGATQVWTARVGPDLGLSETNETSYRWRITNFCSLCRQHPPGSAERSACSSSAARQRKDMSLHFLPGCNDSMPPELPSERWPTGPDGGSPVIGVFAISLPRRKDRQARLFKMLRQRGVPRALVHLVSGVDRLGFNSSDDMLRALGYAAVDWGRFEPLARNTTQERIKGKVGAWLAHLEALSAIARGGSDLDPASWAVVLEDDVVLLDRWATLLAKLEDTARAHPDANLVYLCSREQPFLWDGGRPGYVGVDAYAVRLSVVPSLLRYADLSGPGPAGRTLALDDHFSVLSRRGVLHARTLWGGQSFANLWRRTRSDIEVPP